MRDRKVHLSVLLTGGPLGIKFSPRTLAYLRGLMDGRLAENLLPRVHVSLRPWAVLEEHLLMTCLDDNPNTGSTVRVEIEEVVAMARVPSNSGGCSPWVRQPRNEIVEFWFNGTELCLMEEKFRKHT